MSKINNKSRYSCTTDNKFFTLSIFQGTELDKKVKADLLELRDECFDKGHLCSAVWFKGSNVDDLIEDVTDVHWDAFKKYYVFFDKSKLACAVDEAQGLRIWYPKEHTGPYVYITNNRAGLQFPYKVVGEYGIKIETPPAYSYTLGQYYGYVELIDSPDEIVEWIYGYARDIR